MMNSDHINAVKLVKLLVNQGDRSHPVLAFSDHIYGNNIFNT